MAIVPHSLSPYDSVQFLSPGRARAVVIIIIISSRGPRGSVTLDDVVDGPGAEARYLKEATALKAQV